MREILFQGKRKDNGEWIEGIPLKCVTDCYKKSTRIITEYTEDEFDYFNPMIFYEEVIPETVGQYTGLTDKNGKKIFEGDILESRASDNQDEWKKWICVFDDGSFIFEREIGKRKKSIEQNYICKDEVELYGLEVIGNIHDNPEWLNERTEKQ